MKATPLIVVTALAVAMTGSAFAQKDGVHKALATQADFKALKPGDQLVLVCKTSDSIQIIDIKDAKQALQLCKDGTMVHCPDCKKTYTVRRGGHPAGKGSKVAKRDVVIVNEKGEPCMFYAKLRG